MRWDMHHCGWCSEPTRWVIWMLQDDKKFACDAHLSQAVQKLLDQYTYLHHSVDVAPFDAETMCTCGGPRHRVHCDASDPAPDQHHQEES